MATDNPNLNPAGAATGAQPAAAQPRTTAGRPAAAPGGAEQPAPTNAQSEIGPTTYGAGEVVQHSAEDQVTRDAYAAGHPSQGIAAQRDAARAGTTGQPVQPGFSNPENRGQAPATGTTAPTTGTTAAPQQGVVRVRMTQERDGRLPGQILDLPQAEAQSLIDQGAAERL